jgi:hypothetical protein
MKSTHFLLAFLALLAVSAGLFAEETPPLSHRQISGIYPHLAMYNEENECGTGAVVPWADRLWVITYAPHKPNGSTDKLYEITPDLRQIVRPESVGGTPANRMIHRESRQLFIGPYVIDANRQVRVIPPSKMFGRLTGNARHLFDPAGKIYCATMEEGFYEIDVHTLDVKELWTDEHRKTGRHANIAGYHGKGFYSGQNRLVYSNNGERGNEALRFPNTPSGALVEWDGKADSWTMIRRNQFTEVTGPGGIYGSDSPETDPIWSIGWDHRSLILAVLHEGKWSMYRLPKGSHSYDGAHGWNTEWPRIRDIGEESLMMTMHGTFWKFPKTFTPKSSLGITPRSNYLKVIGDFTTWKDKVVLGCDDAARSEFLNKRNLKGTISGTGQSHSNLWFVDRNQLDQFGPVIGRGSVWLNDDVTAGEASNPYLFSGNDLRSLHLAQKGKQPLSVTLEVDRKGNGEWSRLREIVVPAEGSTWTEFPANEAGAWIRLIPQSNAEGVTACFQYRNRDHRSTEPDPIFTGLATVDTTDLSGGLLYARGENFRTLRFAARNQKGALQGYDLNGDLELKPNGDPVGTKWVEENCAIPQNVITVDAASVLYIDGNKNRWRLPKGDPAFDHPGPLGLSRVCREVCTERDLLNVHGTFYELPAENAGGFSKIRPIASHRFRISDFVSYRGLLVLSGVSASAPEENEHLIRSNDGACALWAGVVDDLWKAGKPRGIGGPWKDSPVNASVPSDPYLMTGYDRKKLTCSHTSDQTIRFTLQVDFTGQGDWTDYQEFNIPPGQEMVYEFPEAFSAYWARLISDQPTTATALFEYN